VAPACVKLGRSALVAPYIPQPLPAAGVPRAPAFLILHPQVVSARRNATVPLLATAFKVEADTVKEAMADIAKEWDAAVERALDIGGPRRPKVTVLLS
jgi:hypothetical protein